MNNLKRQMKVADEIIEKSRIIRDAKIAKIEAKAERTIEFLHKKYTPAGNDLSRFLAVYKERDEAVEAEVVRHIMVARPFNALYYWVRQGYWQSGTQVESEDVAAIEKANARRNRCTVVPGESREWLPVDADESAETAAWLVEKAKCHRNPRRKGGYTDVTESEDYRALHGYQSHHDDSYWYDGYARRMKSDEKAAWER